MLIISGSCLLAETVLQISGDMSNGNFIDIAGNHMITAYRNATQSSIAKIGSSSIYLDGSDALRSQSDPVCIPTQSVGTRLIGVFLCAMAISYLDCDNFEPQKITTLFPETWIGGSNSIQLLHKYDDKICSVITLIIES